MTKRATHVNGGRGAGGSERVLAMLYGGRCSERQHGPTNILLRSEHDPKQSKDDAIRGWPGWFLRQQECGWDQVGCWSWKKRWREVRAAASEQRANRHRLIAVGCRLMAVIGGAPVQAQAALGEGAVWRFEGVTTKYESFKNHQKINEIWSIL